MLDNKELNKQIVELVNTTLAELPLPNEDISKTLGMFFYYHNKLSTLIESIIINICPELKYYLNTKPNISFKEKLNLLMSFTSNHGDLELFNLLKKINSIRNDLAHQEFDESMINIDELSTSFFSSFKILQENEFRRKILKNDKATFLNATVKILMATVQCLNLIKATEIFGREHDSHNSNLKIMNQLQKKARTLVYNRFTSIILQFQTGLSTNEIQEKYNLK